MILFVDACISKCALTDTVLGTIVLLVVEETYCWHCAIPHLRFLSFGEEVVQAQLNTCANCMHVCHQGRVQPEASTYRSETC